VKKIIVWIVGLLWLAACAPAAPQIVKETVVVPQQVTRVVAQEVTRVVERVITTMPSAGGVAEKVITATPSAGGVAEKVITATPSAGGVTEKVITATPSTGVIIEKVEDRLKTWQAQIPPEYAALKNPFPPGDAAAVANGEHLFDKNDCDKCHGDELKGDGEFSAVLNPKPIDLTDPALMNLPFVTDTYLYWRISEGGSQPPFMSAMPIWKLKLSDQERWELVSFIRSQTAPSTASQDQAAIAVIERSGCFACHKLGERGGVIGPTWDGIGTTAATRVPGVSAEEYIRQSILDPGAFASPGFEDRAKVMPRNFGETLTPDEITLIVQFLLRQK